MLNRRELRGTSDPDIALPAALIGDPVRAAIVLALMDGNEMPASELAFRAGTSPQAASAHLSRLIEGGLLAGRSCGRQRLFRLASPGVAHAIEALSAIAEPAPIVALSQSQGMLRLREARSCYDHLAGRLGVRIAERMVDRKILSTNGSAFELTRRGERFFAALGVDVGAARDRRRTFARACMDWTERRPHLAGSLGASLLSFLLVSKWVMRNAHDRSLRLTDEGRAGIARHFDTPA